jgi:hypothetical protein
VCHELRAWRNLGQAQESRRDLWQEFEETTRRADAETPVDPPQPAEAERTEETVSAGA